jgi:hypothetical protein
MSKHELAESDPVSKETCRPVPFGARQDQKIQLGVLDEERGKARHSSRCKSSTAFPISLGLGPPSAQDEIRHGVFDYKMAGACCHLSQNDQLADSGAEIPACRQLRQLPRKRGHAEQASSSF